MRDYCILILRIATSPNSLMNFSSYLLCLNIHFFFNLISVVRISNPMLSKSAESRYTCLFTNHKGNTFCFLSLNIILVVCLPYTAFTMWRCIPFITPL